jgi:hypothetical protein
LENQGRRLEDRYGVDDQSRQISVIRIAHRREFYD